MHGTKAIGMGVLVVTGPGRAGAPRSTSESIRRTEVTRARKTRTPLVARMPVLRRRFA